MGTTRIYSVDMVEKRGKEDTNLFLSNIIICKCLLVRTRGNFIYLFINYFFKIINCKYNGL